MAATEVTLEAAEATLSVDTDPMLPQDESHQESPPEGATDGSHAGGATMISIQRSAYNESSFNSAFGLQPTVAPPVAQRLKSCCAAEFCGCSAECAKKKALSFLPCIDMLRTYKWKKWIGLDLMSGLSVGVIHIPQGMGFAMLTSLPPVYGLYSSFFPVLIYFFFGTSRHISVGTMAVISLMIGSIVDREVANLGLVPPAEGGTGAGWAGNDTTSSSSSSSSSTQASVTGSPPSPPSDFNTQSDYDSAKVGIAISVSLLVGCFQLLMSLLRLGVVATFMSMAFVGSFLTGAAVHIITSQMSSLFGIKLPRHSGMFKVPLTYYELFAHIQLTNVAALVIGLVCMAVLVVLKEVINHRFHKVLKVPIPAELIVVVLATVISHFAGFHDLYAISVVGDIPKGIPVPRLPPMTNASSYVVEAIPIAVLSFTISITMAKLMSRKHRYAIDVNQELLAYGLMNGVGAFFNCFAGCQAPPRTLVHDAVGGKSQLGSLVSCLLVLLVCLWLGPLFYNLPHSVLAAIIVCALLPLFKQFKELPSLWRINKHDFFVWIVTFLSVVLLDITIGLITGIGLSIFFIVLQGHLASGTRLVKVADTELYVPRGERTQSGADNGNDVKVTVVGDVSGVRIFRFEDYLFFANVESFKQQLFSGTVNPQHVTATNLELEINADHDVIKSPNGALDDPPPPPSPPRPPAVTVTANGGGIQNGTRQAKTSPAARLLDPDNPESDENDTITAVILDCSAIPYIDVMGINILRAIRNDYKEVNIRFILAECCSALRRKLEAAELTKVFEIYPSVHDAVAMVTGETTSSWV